MPLHRSKVGSRVLRGSGPLADGKIPPVICLDTDAGSRCSFSQTVSTLPPSPACDCGWVGVRAHLQRYPCRYQLGVRSHNGGSSMLGVLLMRVYTWSRSSLLLWCG